MKLSSFEKLALSAWAALAAAGTALRFGLLSLPELEALGPRCLFKLVTGLPCPGCGMGHSLLHAFGGRWELSWGEHPLGIPFLLLWTAWLLRGAVNAARGRGFSEDWPDLRGRPAWLALGGVLLVYAARNLVK